MSKRDLKTLKHKKDVLVDELKRFEQYVNDTFQTSNDIDQLELRFDTIKNALETYNDLQLEIELIDNNIDFGTDRANFEDKYYSITAKVKAILNKSNSNSVNSKPANNSSISVHLPSINLPNFSGNYGDYTHFRDTFNSLISSNQSLDKIKKFHYLLSCLRGDALNLLKSLEVTDQNYDVAWDLIKERYENKRIIINSHIQAILNINNVPKENAVALRFFTDEVNKHVRALRSLDEKVDSWDSILIHLLTLKLDFNTKKDWESRVQANSMPTLKQFLEFIANRSHLLENVYSRSHPHNDNDSGTKRYAKYNNKSFLSNQPNNATCFYCKEKHVIYQCKAYLSLSPKERFSKAKGLKLCINCLKPQVQKHFCYGHCKLCPLKHNTLLHMDQIMSSDGRDNQQPSKAQPPNQADRDASQPSITLTANSNSSLVLLGTAVVQLQGSDGKFYECRALLDAGSQSNFIKADLAQKLNLEKIKINFPIIGIGGSRTDIQYKVDTMLNDRFNNFEEKLSFLVIHKISGNIPSIKFNYNQLNIPSNIRLSDPEFNRPKDIDILLGASIFYKLLNPGQISLGDNKPILQDSKVGWIVTGDLQLNFLNHKQPHCFLSIEQNNLQNSLEKFWEIENVPNPTLSSKFSKEELFCENHFLKNHYQDESGRFTVALPLKNDPKHIGDTLKIAKKRFLNLEMKLSKNNEMRKLYTDFMQQYETLGHMTKINNNEISSEGTSCYLPHHGVLKMSSETTKLRVVFDGSAKGSFGISLNEIQCVGPVIQDDLFSILLRFRKYNFVLKADITKMYRQVLIKTDQRDLQRILWRSDSSEELQHYRLNTVTYGTASASFLAIRSLQQVGRNNADKYPEASNAILNDFYVDDLITGCDNIDALIKLKSDLSEILTDSGFPLAQWKSNHSAILKLKGIKQDSISFAEDEVTKTLGISWNPNTDNFNFNINFNLDFKFFTKRRALSLSSQVFDPLGLLGPIIINAKLIIQQLWTLNISWDEPIPIDHNKLFFKYFLDLGHLNRISIPRHVLTTNSLNVQLHGFADASNKAYGACLYLRSIDFNGKIFTQLLCSKTRVAPLKVISLPRLELCAALLLSRLTVKIIKSINIIFKAIYLWSDSNIVLAWLSKEPHIWKTFVSNRLSEIQMLTNSMTWQHVKSEDNPADLASRGCESSGIIHSDLWWSGPAWLTTTESEWPKDIPNVESELPEQKRVKDVLCLVSLEGFDLFDRYSSLDKLLRITALCLRFYHNLKGKINKLTGRITISEIKQAKTTLVKIVQAIHFPKEIHDLKLKKPLSKHSRLLSLHPFVDVDGLLRVGGRLAHSNVSYDRKFPAILPTKHILTTLIITDEHERLLHAGTQTILSSVREQFWPISGKNLCKKVIRNCIVCFKARPRDSSYLMGNLPEMRVNNYTPFYNVGTDFCGPFLLRDKKGRGSKNTKAYVCLFVCMSSKAVHLEIVSELTTEAFLATLNRFVSRRGKPLNIYSDNALNYIGANNELCNIYKMLDTDNDKITNALMSEKINWHFIPARSPTFGGLWEAGIKLTKFHLKRVIGINSFTFEQLNTIICRVEAILNSRPLCSLSNDPNDPMPLTPGHFLIGKSLVSVPEPDLTEIKESRLSKWQHLNAIIQHFWKRWAKEYLSELQTRNKWKQDSPSTVNEDTIVLLKEDNTPPMTWPLGRIVKLYPGKDNVVRVVDVKVRNTVVKRAITRICVLPLSDSV